MGLPRLAVHKFSSCDGCQLALLNLGEGLLALARRVEIVHFAEAGPVNPEAEVDVALIEGSISTPEEAERILGIRQRSRYLVTIGACATSGGIQSLRNAADLDAWRGAIYASPEFVASLAEVKPLSALVKVDLELWGCPINSRQLLAALEGLLAGTVLQPRAEKVCMECRRAGHACVLTSRGEPCMGPATAAGCGALCPSVGRACYGCYGPAEAGNVTGFRQVLAGIGLAPAAQDQRLRLIHSQADDWKAAGDD